MFDTEHSAGGHVPSNATKKDKTGAVMVAKALDDGQPTILESLDDVEVKNEYPVIRNGLDVSRFLISDRDDGDPSFTFRSIVLGTVFTLLASIITMLYQFKPTSGISVSATFLQIIIFVCGEAWARLTPRPDRFSRSSKVSAILRFMNSGQPFGIKEHVVASLIASSGNNGLSGVEIYAIERLYYNRSVQALTVVMGTFSISLCGFVVAGLLRPLVVYPSEMVYWGSLPQVILFQGLHYNRHVNRKVLYAFGIAILSAAVWELFPAYMFTWLSGVSIFCVASIRAPTTVRSIFGKIFGGSSSNQGVGILNFGLDWQYIQSQYMAFPPKLLLNFGIGTVLFYIFMLALYYGNAWGSKETGLPFMSTALYTSSGAQYPVTSILNAQGFVDYSKFFSIGSPRLTSSTVWGFFTQNVAIGALVTHVLMFYRKDMMLAWRQARDRSQPDPHFQAMLKYKEVPTWWYGALFALCFIAGLIANTRGETTLEWWAYLVALALGAFLAPFSMILYALYGTGVSTNQLSKMVAGVVQPGRPLAGLYFASWSHQVILLAVNLANWLKVGQYTKIPPRVMFSTQIYATLLGAAFNYIVMTIIVTNQREILLSPQGNQIWSGSFLQSLNTQAITWALAKDVYSASSRYFIVPIGIIIGLALPMIHAVISRFSPMVRSWPLNTALIMTYAGSAYYGQTSYLSTALAVGVFTQMYLRKRHPEIFNKYNYVVGAGLDGGAQIIILVLSFAVYGASGKTTPFPRWWGAPRGDVNPDHCM
ncbi:hypothetical protein M409DRAFT_65680 [Zasmidium cellare ATCC 36951]|uniref:OPT peptide transporter Mtd1 n=1 Tax=Zasmidium cellare ATCC 36951 TaxID=1080233 RepID=A0A6A6CPN1_ZASCE|nr:uncharacterized protein M409DRAFT_65680 [Zasmidium cellare ATCC 36951]KAF2168188.1 hypothetical protein M409DRAFT_65680 [Zasmidium cellare ATCC 36951]